MTYIDKNLSDGKSFINAGFVKDETYQDERNLKMIFTPKRIEV